MARRQGRRKPSLSRALGLVLSLGLILGACQTGEVGDTSSRPPETTSTSTTTTTSTSTTTTTMVTTTTTAPQSTTTSQIDGAIIGVPDGDGPFPAVVLVHGGGWIVGTTESMEPLATYLTSQGFLTVNTTYQLSIRATGFPSAVQDVVCAVSYAGSHERSNGTVTIIGHSAGAHIGAIAALAGESYTNDCPGAELPQNFVGLAGPYDSNRLGPILIPFFGGEQIEIPEVWDAGDPQLLVGSNPDLHVLLLHGDADPVVPIDFSHNFFNALEDAGVDIEMIELEGADHPDARDPAVVGALIVDWLTDE